LKAAKISPKFARTIGIAVDFRRRNRSVESLTLNVQRLKAYKEKLILFPKVKNQFRKGDSKAKDCRAAKQVLLGDVLPIKQPPNKEQTLPVEYINTKISAYQTMRMARAEARLVGIRLKRSQEKAAAESLSTKA
jgi:large subunit ribosomal protein L13e